jgi:hypothetical protein
MHSELLQISIVKKGKHKSRERARELFRELALLHVPWEALETGFCSRFSPEREFSMEESTYHDRKAGYGDADWDDGEYEPMFREV